MPRTNSELENPHQNIEKGALNGNADTRGLAISDNNNDFNAAKAAQKDTSNLHDMQIDGLNNNNKISDKAEAQEEQKEDPKQDKQELAPEQPEQQNDKPAPEPETTSPPPESQMSPSLPNGADSQPDQATQA